MVCQHPDKSCAHRDCDNGYMFLICHLTTYLKSYVNLWVGTFEISHQLAIFGGHWSGARGDIKY